MAKAASARKTKAAARGATPGKSWFWLQGVICGGVAATLPGTACVIVVLLAPALAAYATEQSAGRPLARAMLLTGLASTFMPLRLLWEHGGSLDVALDLLSDPARPLLSWAACGAGWLAGQTADVTTRMVLNAQAERSLRGLIKEKEVLTAEWVDAPRR